MTASPHPTQTSGAQIGDPGPWFGRLLMVHPVYGFLGGFVVPIFGNIVLTLFALVVAPVMAVLVAAFGRRRPSWQRNIVVGCCVALAAAMIAISWDATPLGTVPWLGGVAAHALMAGPPQAGSLRDILVGSGGSAVGIPTNVGIVGPGPTISTFVAPLGSSPGSVSRRRRRSIALIPVIVTIAALIVANTSS
jgi:hypothetical protein